MLDFCGNVSYNLISCNKPKTVGAKGINPTEEKYCESAYFADSPLSLCSEGFYS